MHNKAKPLIVILGPTASGKTTLAIQLAQQINGAIISADSRQVYRGMDIGTGKDLEEYQDISHHLIDIVDPGQHYNVSAYAKEAERAEQLILAQNLQPILCGGTGMYIDSVLRGLPYSHVPKNMELRFELEQLETDELIKILTSLVLPENFKADQSTRKRIIRAIEIAKWHQYNPHVVKNEHKSRHAIVFGLNPAVEERRKRITQRLNKRLESGLIDEVKGLLEKGISSEQLIFYGLEYKYVTLYLEGELNYETMVSRLNTEIHRFAKRQMTYFRKMEKDGLCIHWLNNTPDENSLERVISTITAI